MAVKFFEGGSTANYLIGGTRFWFNRLIDDSVTPNLFRGYRDVGNVKQAPATPEREVKDHFSARRGGRRRDLSLTQEMGEDIVVTFDELSAENMWNYLKSMSMTQVASSAPAVTDYVGQFFQTDTVIIPDYNPSAIVVKDITGVTTYVLNTDYTVVNVIGGYKGIQRVTAGGIADLAYIRVNYTGAERAHRLLQPGTQTNIFGQCILFGVSETGPEFVRSYRKVQLESEGSMEVKPDDWSEWQLHIKVLDDSEVTPTAPWGLFKYYGSGSNIYKGA